jgi:glycosyltransferase involved in cell wall biosynthesis
MQLRGLHDIRPYLHYAVHWDRELPQDALPGIVGAKTAFKRVVPQSYEVLRALRQVSFWAGLQRHAINVYHAPNFLPLRFNGPTVITVHDLSFLRYPQTHPEERVRVMERRLPAAISTAAFILVDSEFVRKEVLEVYAPPPEKVVTIYLGVSERFRPMSAEQTRPVLERHGLAHGRYVLSVGTLEPRKNLAGTLEAFSMLPEKVRSSFPLVVVGMLGWHVNDLSARLRRLTSDGCVRAMGYVPDDDLPYLYAGCAAFIYPSIYEGFGLPVLEALAAGVPVITSNRASLTEVAGDHAVTLDPHDFPSLSEALYKALQSDGVAGAQERRVAWARTFNWKRCAEQTAAIYRRALNGRAAHR